MLAGPAPEDSGPRAAEPHRTPVEHVFFRPPETQAPPSPAQEIPEEYDLLGDDAAAEPGPPPEAHPFADPFAEPEPGGARPESVPVGLGEAPPKAEPEPDLAMRPQAPAGDLWAEQAIEMSAPPPVEPQPPAPVVPPQAPEPRPVQAAEAVGPGADLLAAFVRGLGTGDPSQVRDPGALLRDAGALLRALADGLTATMMARARFKSELKLAVTTIRRSENNPFKFSTSADEALERLLLRPNKAFLDPLESARGAFEDIQAHEMAMIAGLRAAMRALLARFEPGALEARMQTASGLDRLLPMARKSRYWELFNQTYGQVAADAAEDFMELFGESFIRAYEDQIARLAQARARSQGRPPD
jgi:type VI secretion system protein